MSPDKKRMGLLAGSVNFSNAAEDEFHDWLDTEHIPERERIPGVLKVVRWLGVENPKTSIVLYDLESLDVLKTPEYLAVSFNHFTPWSRRMLFGNKTRRITRFACEQIWPGDRMAPPEARGLAVFALNVPAEHEEAFNRWTDGEHIPALSAVPGVLCVRRYMSHAGDGEKFVAHKYVMLVHMETPEVCQLAAWKSAMETPSARAMESKTTDRLHMVMRRYVRSAPMY